MHNLTNTNNAKEASHQTGLEIAIIGMAGRFPGAQTIDEFWRNLRDGVESISTFSDAELIAAGVDPALLGQPNYVKAGTVLDDIEMFDAGFFGYAPREAEILSPQHRFFLECAHEALENAGCNPQTYKSPIGVYAAASTNDYALYNLFSNPDIVEAVGAFPIAIANGEYLSTLVSYKLDLRGASITVNTACSSSLVAMHLACQGLLSGDCGMALAGGVSIRLPQASGYLYQEGGILSDDGHCRAFDTSAKGAVVGNGVGIVVLKRLEDALADGDRIEAVIKGTAVNNDGAWKIGYTAPSIEGQANAIRAAQVSAEIEPETISYIEAHGTATPLGDPIEIAALTQAFRASTAKTGFCAIGSLKTNLGHMDAAAGVAGVMKTALALRHKMLPPSLHFRQPNPKIDFDSSPFYVNTQLSEWKAADLPLRAGVSSFGIGGTNAHAILEEAPQIEANDIEKSARPWQLLILSAKTETALETMTANLAEHLQKNTDVDFADVAYTLQVGRRTFDRRRILVCRDREEAIAMLKSPASDSLATTVQERTDRGVTFLFPGQGSQYVNMGRELYQVEPTFRKELDRCAKLLQPHLGLDLLTVLFPVEGDEEAAQAQLQLQQTYLTQPALFAIEYALAKLWMSWGIKPQAAIGHSIGEYVAACLAGVFALEDALALVATRARLMQELPQGAMLSVPLPAAEIQTLLNEHPNAQLALAAINTPSQCVVSGATEAIAALQDRLRSRGIEYRLLHTSHAFHSAMMEPICSQFADRVASVDLHPPQMPYLSNVTGIWITAAEATTPSYWAKHLRQTVLFADGVRELLQQSDRVFLEVGPGRTLSTFVRQHGDRAGDPTGEIAVVASMRHPRDRNSDVAFIQNSLGQLWMAGVPVDWSGLYVRERRQRLSLPTYPFERHRYWIDAPTPANTFSSNGNGSNGISSNGNQSSQSLLYKKSDVADWLYTPVWKRTLVPTARSSRAPESLRALIFTDRCGLGDGVATRLEREGWDVVMVKIDSEFAQLSDRLYTIDPGNRNCYDLLFESLCLQDWYPQQIVHLWSFGDADRDCQRWERESELDQIDDLQKTGFYSLLFIAQALVKNKLTDKLQIATVSDRLQQVTGTDSLCPAKATILGSLKVIPQEYPHITCRSIDAIAPASPTSLPKLVDQIVAELSADTSDTAIAYRGSYRWVQTFEPARWEESDPDRLRIRENGVYLITGGLGQIGLVLAEHFARSAPCRLILVGRSAFPARCDWEQYLAAKDTSNASDRTSQKIQKFLELEALGSKILVVSSDVGNLQQMQAAIALAEEQFGTLHGVVHTAGVTGAEAFNAIGQITARECLQQFHPKVRGAAVLRTVLAERELDFCVLMSSLSSILGGLGFVAYAAANAFLDAIAQEANQQLTNSTPWISVNWDGWQFDSLRTATASGHGNLAELALTPDEGIQALQRILTRPDLERWVVSTGDLQARLDRWVQPQSLSDRARSGNVGSSRVRPSLRSAYVTPSNEIEQTIAKTWESILGIEAIGIHDDFFELGGNSLMAIQIISRLREIYCVDLPVDVFFEIPTIHNAARAVLEVQISDTDADLLAQMLAEVTQLSEEDAQKQLSAKESM
jgi:acyl transferase domain-containing protein/acyl carrier protein